MAGGPATLLSCSATSGWTDWIWGELWLFPDGILRVPTDAGTTRQRVRERRRAPGRSTAPLKPLPRSVFDDDPARLAEETKRARWLPRDQIKTASLRRGLLNSRLSVELADGREVKLLWLKSDVQAFDLIERTLRDWLGSRLRVR
jgi:hypothetical protein